MQAHSLGPAKLPVADVLPESGSDRESLDRIRLFSPKVERLFLIVPLFFLLPTALELIGWFTLSGKGIKLSRIFSDIIFLGTIHSVLSFVIMAFLPEVRQWMRAIGGGSMWRFMFRFAAVSTVIGLLMLCATTLTNDSPLVLALIVSLVSVTFGKRHFVRQVQGLSLAYNQKIRTAIALTEAELKRMVVLEKREKICFSVLIFCTCMISISTLSQFLKRLPILGAALPVFVVAGVLASFWLLWLTLQTPHRSRSNKLIYNLRGLLVTFHTLSFSANCGMHCVHGTEFLAVTGQMVKNSKMPRKRILWFVVLSVLFVAFAGLCTLNKRALFRGYVLLHYPAYSTVWVILATLDLSFSYIHYYTDAIMFRFRSPESRQWIAPLLK